MKSERNRMQRFGCLAMMCLALDAGPVAAAERQVVVNGKLLGPAALKKLDRQDCRTIPDGEYKHDHARGIWGPADGSKPWRRLGEHCRHSGSEAQMKRSIEREMSGSAPESTAPRREEPITGTSPLMRGEQGSQ